MIFYITVSAKENLTLQKFLIFFSKINIFASSIFSQKQKKNSHKFVTVLKSPHINKTAQEQFEFKVFSVQVTLNPINSFLCLKILKRIFKKSFPGLKLSFFANSASNKKFSPFSTNGHINPDNIKLNLKTPKKKIKFYFSTFDSFGEICIQRYNINGFNSI